ncbi:hypothetical protein GCM10008014_15160 [Paenibacillus silvae]|uniref:Carrier domain-containing protein n=1 Tax=Paenibacillus silvae TaxID=1325358 RepID=A0ABQ1Z4Q4_9BACL|nr:acyl carrier protein [Paenibacillus silvae]GGH50215.1 hypothetical protein GCM10008014_15160 [Paenibacillus silvae]
MLNDEVLEAINKAKRIPVPVVPDSHFFMDLGLDSLGFVAFLLQLERRYTITFDIMEIEQCVQVDRLLELIHFKVKECSHDHD